MEPRINATWIACAALGCGTVSSPDDAGAIRCDPLARFDAPRPLTNLIASLRPADANLSRDELTLFLSQSSATGDRDLFTAARGLNTVEFDSPVALTSVNSSGGDAAPNISPDDLTLLFHSDRISGEGFHLYVSTRDSALASFGAPAPLAGVASPVKTDNDLQPTLTPDGQALWFASNRNGNLDLYRAVRVGGGYANPVQVFELSSPSSDQHATLSADGLTIYFASDRPFFGARGGFETFRAQRASVNDAFSPPTLVEELNTSKDDNPRWLSPDNCRLYLHSDAGGSFDIYVATRSPSP